MDEVRECLDSCAACQKACAATVGSAAAKASRELADLLTDCVEACAASIGFLKRGSSYAPLYCGICSEIAEHCAEHCDASGASELERVAATCHHCALACNRMSAPTTTQAALEPSA